MSVNSGALVGLVRRTPLIGLEGRLYGKAENLQTGRSYKMRGVAQALTGLPNRELARGISTVSAGNLGQAVALAAKRLEIPCQIYVPDSAPLIKKKKIQDLGAELVPLPFDVIWEMVLGKGPETPMHFLHPCRSAELRQGYGTIAREILEDRSDVEAVVIPYGLGSLCLGVATALKELKPGVKIYACEIESAAPLAVALGQRAHTQFQRSSLVDAIGTPEVIPEIFKEVSPLLEGSLVVSDLEVRRAWKRLDNLGQPVEGAAAAAYAAAQRLLATHRTICCVLSGGNADRSA